jgi:hypothetical protein
LFHTDCIENDVSNNSSIVAFAFFTARAAYQAIAWQRYGGYICNNTDLWEGFMKYAIEMDSGAMIYIPSFIRHSDVEGGGTHRQQGDLISLRNVG